MGTTGADLLPKSYFLYVGNVYPHKNIEVLLDAFHRLQTRGNVPVQLVFVGPEDYFYKKLKLIIISLEMQDTVKVLHRLRDEELQEAYARAIALVFPSRMEGFGLPALEALASGCRVIASDIPVFHEILQNHATYANTTSAESLATVLHQVYSAPFDKKSFQKSLVPFLSKYSWSTMSAHTLRVYSTGQTA